ncbi:MAG: AI-2E family transporter, partial [Thermoanaerobaculia bacterium]
MDSPSPKPAEARRPWPSPAVGALLSSSLVVLILWCARVVLIPIALAILLAFLLGPVVDRLERARFSRAPAVLVTLAGVVLVAAGIVAFVGFELSRFVNEVPLYQENMRTKVKALKEQGKAGPFAKVRSALEDVARERDPLPALPLASKTGKRSAPSVTSPLPVRIIEDGKGSERMLDDAAASLAALKPTLEGLANGILALVLAVFMLLRREDLRNRLVSLASTGGLATTTKALDEAGRRISRYLRVQLLVNGTFGIAIALGLFLLHVPYALLWGFCAAVLRYVPYVGTWIAALLPMTVGFIVFPGWRESVQVFVLFFVLHVFTANAIEPRLYGQGIGVSEVALLVSAAFWAWIWGPVGLILAAPLTVGVVVMARYVPSFAFLERLLGDNPSLEPAFVYLQRLLARDVREAASVVRRFQAEHPRESIHDGLFVPTLARIRADRASELMSAADEEFALAHTAALVDQLGEEPESTGDPIERVLGCPARLEMEETALGMLDQLGRAAGFRVEAFSTRRLSSEVIAQVAARRPRVVVVSVMPPDGLPQAEHLCRSLRSRLPEVAIVVGYWGHRLELDDIISKLRAAGASYVTTTLLGAREHISSILAAAPRPAPA